MKVDAIYCGDSIQLLNASPPEWVHLIFADPPYNIGYVYDQYHDDRPDDEYVEWSRQWMAACQRVLAPDGSLYIAIGDEFAAEIRVIGRKLGLHLRNWIIWHYSFGQNMRTKFSRSHTHIFYFTRHAKRFTFNDRMVRYPSARHTRYQDLRAHPQGRVPDDVWSEFPRVCGTFRERDGYHGCQLPEALLMRIIMASSNPGDIVLDPFVGSGTTVAVAKRLGRRFVGIDLSQEYCARSRLRLAQVADESRCPAAAAGQQWPQLHRDVLMLLYRETGVALRNLLPNAVAMRVLSASLNQRLGTDYTPERVAEALEAARRAAVLPRLANDDDFVLRGHVRNEGKRYNRQVFRWRGRKQPGGPLAMDLRDAS